ncbi:hypothetical protein BGZ46_009454 [Entomortierella lignicola]|nr:hypothetical protein BGZ46_009454 [Entomortierella lignicola]
MAFATTSSSVPLNEHSSFKNGASVSGININLDKDRKQFQHERQQQPVLAQQTRVSTKALAITSCASGGSAPPPLMGSAIVLANDYAMHCFGGRLENRKLTNCHYVLDVETGIWDAIQAAPASSDTTGIESEAATGGESNNELSSTSQAKKENISLSLATDPVDTDSGPISGTTTIQPSPRYFHTLNAFGTSLILFGGMGNVQDSEDKEKKDEDGSNEQAGKGDTENQEKLEALNDLWVFDIVSQRWQQKYPPVNSHSPRPRWAHMATIMDHYLVVIGGTDTFKAYVEDACVLDLHTWEWVATIQSIGQCGSYRTVAATGPSKLSSTTAEPAASSFPSADASSPQTSSNLARPLTDSGPIDAMASISMVLSGRISAPSSTSSTKDDDTSETVTSQGGKRKHSERLLSGELTPAFRTGKDLPSIYLYSNYNFTNLTREFKVIMPHYSQPNIAASDTTSVVPPSFSLIEKSQALSMMGAGLPPGLRFPQGHVYQNQLILTGTLIIPNKAPGLAIYTLNLTQYKWERLDTDTLLEVGSWNRTILHPATGTLFVFGNQLSDPRKDYASRIQHHNHFMLVDLQAYGFYNRPVPSLPQAAQELGFELLSSSSLCDMQISSVTGTMFGANSTILAARWPEFASLLLSPPYVTPLILVLPVPDDVVQLFLEYLYTGALPSDITAGIADYLLILARKYELNGLHALTMDILHQTVHLRPVRIYSTALLAGELGLQARAVGLAMPKLPAMAASVNASYLTSTVEGKELPPLPSPSSTAGSSSNSTGLSRTFSRRAPPPPPLSSAPYMKTHHRNFSAQSRESLSTDGGFIAEGLLQQYNDGQRQIPTTIPEDDIDPRRHFSMASPTLVSPSTVGRGSDISTLINSPTSQGYGGYNQNGYPSPMSPGSFSTQMRGFGHDDYPQDERTLQAKKRLQKQMQQEPDLLYHPQYDTQYQEYIHQQEMVVMEQHRLQQRYPQAQQQPIQAHQLQVEQPNPLAVVNELDYHFGGVKQTSPSAFRIRSPNEGMRVEAPSSQMGSISSKSDKEKAKDKEKEKKKEKEREKEREKREKNVLSKMKPPKPMLSGAELMKSAGF